nr:hypothetical protein [Armatimonadota bacterium]
VQVRFTNATSQFSLQVNAPANTLSDVYLPRFGGDDLQVTVDGVPLEGRADGPFIVMEGIGSGAHTLVRKKG